MIILKKFFAGLSENTKTTKYQQRSGKIVATLIKMIPKITDTPPKLDMQNLEKLVNSKRKTNPKPKPKPIRRRISI
eukprot:UN12003